MHRRLVASEKLNLPRGILEKTGRFSSPRLLPVPDDCDIFGCFLTGKIEGQSSDQADVKPNRIRWLQVGGSENFLGWGKENHIIHPAGALSVDVRAIRIKNQVHDSKTREIAN